MACSMGLSGVDENGDNKVLLNLSGHACSFGFWVIAAILVGCVRDNVRKGTVSQRLAAQAADCCCSFWCLSVQFASLAHYRRTAEGARWLLQKRRRGRYWGR